jgi:inosine-uridine nucleoside N-ribohydrolase
MKRTVLYIFLATGVSMFLFSCDHNRLEPVPIIFDTDLGPDFDDVGALTILHALADSGEARILATISCNRNELVVPCIDVINHYYGRPDLPVGVSAAGVDMSDWHEEKWPEVLVVKFPHRIKSSNDAPDAVSVYRSILAKEPDNSVVVVTVGFFTNLAALLQSQPDQYSDLNGKQLVEKKVKHLVSMAGYFPEGREFNVFIDSVASVAAIKDWPTKIILSGFETGQKVLTGKRLIAADIANTPAKEVYTVCLRQGDFDGRQSWDQTAVLVAVRGTDKYFNTVKGWMHLEKNGNNFWQDDPDGKHEHLTWKMPVEELTKIIEELMMHQPIDN